MGWTKPIIRSFACIVLLFIFAACGSEDVDQEAVSAQAHFDIVESIDDIQHIGGEYGRIEYILDEEDFPHLLLMTIEWTSPEDAEGQFEFMIQKPEHWDRFGLAGHEVVRWGRDSDIAELEEQHQDLLGWSMQPPFGRSYRVTDLSPGSITILFTHRFEESLIPDAANVHLYMGYIGEDDMWVEEVPIDLGRLPEN